jgi:hypothetical protein
MWCGTEKSHQHVPHALEQSWQLFQHLAATQFLGIVDDTSMRRTRPPMDEVYQKLIDRTRAPLDLKQVKTIFGFSHRPHHTAKRGRERIEVFKAVQAASDDHEIETALRVPHLNERPCHGRTRRIGDDAGQGANSALRRRWQSRSPAMKPARLVRTRPDDPLGIVAGHAFRFNAAGLSLNQLCSRSGQREAEQ